MKLLWWRLLDALLPRITTAVDRDWRSGVLTSLRVQHHRDGTVTVLSARFYKLCHPSDCDAECPGAEIL